MSGAESAGAAAAAGAAGDAAAVEAANAALYAAVEAGDLDAMARLWVDGSAAGSAVCVHPGWAPIQGRSRVLRAWALIMASTSYIQFFLTDLEVTVVGDVGTVTCIENILTGVGGESGVGGLDGLPGGQVASTNVFRRTADGWRVWLHHASPVMTMTSGAALDDGLGDLEGTEGLDGIEGLDGTDESGGG